MTFIVDPMSDLSKSLRRLPADARPVLIELDGLAADDLGSAREIQSRLAGLHEQRAMVEAAFRAQMARSGRAPTETEQQEHADALAAFKPDIDRLEGARARMKARWSNSAATLDACLAFVDANPKLAAVKAPRAVRTIEEVRAAIDANRAEHSKTSAAPLPKAQLIAAIEQQLDAEAGRVGLAFDPARRTDPFGLGSILNPHDPSSGLGLTFLIAVLGDVIADRLAVLIPDDDGSEMGDEQRNARLAHLDRDLLVLERKEEMVIRQASRDGRRIDRRPDASPLAILGVTYG